MPEGDAAELVEAYRASFRDCLIRINEPSLLHLRGELQVMARWLETRNDAKRAQAAATALDALSRFYSFGVEIGGFERSSKTANQASVFDLASVGVLAVENLPLLYVGVVLAKICHEFGHALACKTFGRQEAAGHEVHVMGVMFLIFTPLLIMQKGPIATSSSMDAPLSTIADPCISVAITTPCPDFLSQPWR